MATPLPKKHLEIFITPGDPEGIGPEVTAKALTKIHASKSIRFVIVARKIAFGNYLQKIPKSVRWIEPESGIPGLQAAQSVQIATQNVLISPLSRALVTGPISKDRLIRAGLDFPGHTEFLAFLSAVPSATMMLENPTFRVALATVHVPLDRVSRSVRVETLDLRLEHLFYYLKYLRIKLPKIAVLGLNPHAGENGQLGREEIDCLNPWIQIAKKIWAGKAEIDGPFPADTFFALELSKTKPQRYDAILAMYHDQGLAVVKAIDFKNTVNLTLGLPFIRTSVDHGTAFDIAGKNKADPSSMVAAIRRAMNLLNRRGLK